MVNSPEHSNSSPYAALPRLEDVITTDQLRTRPSRDPDHAAETAAFLELTRYVAEFPDKVLQKLADTAMDLTRAGSAGISMSETNAAGESVFRWRATSGDFFPFAGNTLPRDFSPCGVVLDTNTIQLMTQPERFYPYIAQIKPPVEEVLLVPFHRYNKPIGTIWVVGHTFKRQFDGEDARLLLSLSQFASSAAETLAAI